MNRLVAALVLLLITAGFVRSQNIDDTTTVLHSPKKAAIMSACLPGLGQVYNRKYWKVPVLYAGLGGVGYSIYFNNKYYQSFRKAYIARTDNLLETTDEYPRYSATNLLDLRNYYRHNLELSIIILSAVYILNIVDASVDAHLYDFDISNDLSLSLQPSMWSQNAMAPVAGGITLTLKFKP